MNEDIFKIEKPQFTEIVSKDGKSYGVCSICGNLESIDDHYCMSMIEEDTDFKTTIESFKSSNIIQLNDGQIKYINQRFNSLHIKYSNNKFFKTLVDKANNEKFLYIKQYNELSYLLKHGKSMYENNYLTTKN